MPTRLKIQTDSKDKVVLESVFDSLTDSTLTIELSHNLLAWSKGFFNLDTIGFPVNDDATQNVIDEKILSVEITGPTPILTTFRNLIFLKDEVKGLEDHAQNIFDFELIIDKDLNDQNDHWNITEESVPNANDRTIKLSTANFGGVLETSKISIDDTNYPGGIDTEVEILESRHNQKQALLDLEKLIKEDFTDYLSNLFGGSDARVNIPRATILGNRPDPAANPPVAGTGLWAYYSGNTIPLVPPIVYDQAEIQQVLFNLKNNYGNEIYRDTIEDLINIFESVDLLIENGFDKKSQIIISLGDDGGEYGGKLKKELVELFKEPGFYKGFPLIDPNLKAVFDPTDNKLKVEKIDPDKLVWYNRKNIRYFRNFAKDYTGSNSDIFTKEKTIKDRNGQDVQVFANRQPNECLGFQPGDVSKDGDDYLYVNGGWYFRGKSKICYDIYSAQNAQEAMDLAFFGKDYDQPKSDSSPRPDNNSNHDFRKNPNINLLFNEVKSWTRQETLDNYYEALKESGDCEWRIPGDAAGVGAQDAPKYDDPDTKDKIDKGYQLAMKFITDYEAWLGVNVSSLDKTQLEEAKAELEKWKNTRFYTSGGVWKPVIDNFLTEVEGALSLLNEDPDDDVPTWKTELAGLKNRGGELAKKIYQKCQPDQDGFTEVVFSELKKLVKLLEEAFGVPTANTKQELEQFIADSENNTDQKQALDIAKKVKNQDNDGADCVATAREKLMSPQEKSLKAARQKLKSLLAGLKIGSQDAYEVMITDIKDSETALNKVNEIWQKCQEVNAATNDDKGELLDALNNLKNDSHNSEAWTAINKYKKDGQNQGYAEEMLKKLNDWANQRQKDYSQVKNAQNPSEFVAAKKGFINKHEYRNNKQDYDEVYFPLAEKAAEIREQENSAGSDEKELVELMVVVVSDYTDWKTQLTDLENKSNKLKNYVRGGKKHNIVANYSSVQQEALEKLASKMEAKVSEWRTAKSQAESGNQSSENPPWYRTPVGITMIIVGVVGILAGIIYYLVRKSNQDTWSEEN